ncbi:MAG: hypothetical protein KDA85_13995, partial [Planctomycetaceae bacterium]|nr:hypothetical protein [Planctomycetaceae bacterium]
MTQLHDRIQAVHHRQQLAWGWKCVSTGLLVGSLSGALIAIVRLSMHGAFSWMWVMAPGLLGLLTGAVWSQIRRSSLKDAACAIDAMCQLKDRAQTALQFLQMDDSDLNEMRQLQIADAEEYAATVQVEKVEPIAGPRLWPIALTVTALNVLLAFLSGPPAEIHAAELRNVVVEEQADRIDSELNELKKLQAEERNPQLDQLIREMQELVEQMKQLGLAPKEALARLSEMEVSLQQAEQRLNDPQAAAELQQIGEALSLSQEMATAGEALAKGELEKAAEELDRLEMPQLDRQSEKAITEQLNKVSQSPENGQNKSASQDAASQISQGLSQGS